MLGRSLFGFQRVQSRYTGDDVFQIIFSVSCLVKNQKHTLRVFEQQGYKAICTRIELLIFRTTESRYSPIIRVDYDRHDF